MPHSKFGWSLPPGCTRLPGDMDDPDDTRCAQCNRDLDEAWENYDDRPDEASEDDYEASPMMEGFCCWACARDYQATLIVRNHGQVSETIEADQRRAFERYVAAAKGAEAPAVLIEDSDQYDPCDDRENPEVTRG
jgi:hypothetical protein